MSRIEPTLRLFANAVCYITDHIAPVLHDAYAVSLLQHITRKTLGYRKLKDVISYSQFKAMTGWCNSTIAAALQTLLDAGLITRQRAGKSFRYALAFVDKVLRVSPELSTASGASDAQLSFFPHSALCETERQISNTETGLENEVSEVVGVINSDIEGGNFGYRLRNLPYLVSRARALGMTGGDLYALWLDCKRQATRPAAFLLWTLKAQGKPPRPVPKPPVSDTKQRFIEMLRAG